MRAAIHLAPLLFAAALATAQDTAVAEPVPPSDRELVRRAVADYVEGIYGVEPARIRRSVDPQLVKLGFGKRGPEDPYRALKMTYEELVALAAEYNQEGRIPDDAPKEIEVLHVVDQIACAKLTAAWGIDYMQLVKRDGSWKIKHVLWQSAPADGAVVADGAPAAVENAVEKAVADYVGAFYQARPAWIDRSVHEELAKFGFYRAPGADGARPMPMSFDQLRSLAASLHATDGPPVDAPKEIEVLDCLDQTAAARLVAEWGIDYMHLARFDGTWKVIHVVWQSHPVAAPEAARKR